MNGMMPFVFQQQAPQLPMPPDVPARVRVAMSLLDDLTRKTATRVDSNGVGFNECDGQQLTVGERQVQTAALSLLAAYFDGKLEPKRKSKRPKGAVKVSCPGCCLTNVNKQPDCPYCGGSGEVYLSRVE